MPSTWYARPVFISSTFKDMQAERDWLQRRVFPRLEEELRKCRHHLEPIDLRRGWIPPRKYRGRTLLCYFISDDMKCAHRL